MRFVHAFLLVALRNCPEKSSITPTPLFALIFFQGVANLGPKSRQDIVRVRLGHDPQSFFQRRLLDHGQSGSSDRRRPTHAARTANQCRNTAPK